MSMSSSGSRALQRLLCQAAQTWAASSQQGVPAACTHRALQQVLQQHGHSFRHLSNQSLDDKTLVERQLLVNPLDLARKFEASGLQRSAAEQLAEHITQVIVLNKLRMEDTFVSKNILDKVVMEQESKVLGFKAELTKAQDMAQANVNKDMERQQSFLDKMRTEVKHEIDKLTASQRLDMNLEKGRMRDDLQLIRDKTTELEIKVDRDINELKSAVEKAKNDTIKSVITILGTFSAIAFTISRFMQLAGN